VGTLIQSDETLYLKDTTKDKHPLWLSILLTLSVMPFCGCQSVQPSLRLSQARTPNSFKKQESEQGDLENRLSVKYLELDNGANITLGTPRDQALEILGHPALKIYESQRVVWVLADGTELSIVDDAVSNIEISNDAGFDQRGYYRHHRMRHHGGVAAVLSAIQPTSRAKKLKSKKPAKKPSIIYGPWIWHGPNFSRTKRKSAPRKRVAKQRRPQTGFTLFIIR
jgi:hypothetical protein